MICRFIKKKNISLFETWLLHLARASFNIRHPPERIVTV
jgi:hypothetical protein